MAEKRLKRSGFQEGQREIKRNEEERRRLHKDRHKKKKMGENI